MEDKEIHAEQGQVFRRTRRKLAGPGEDMARRRHGELGNACSPVERDAASNQKLWKGRNFSISKCCIPQKRIGFQARKAPAWEAPGYGPASTLDIGHCLHHGWIVFPACRARNQHEIAFLARLPSFQRAEATNDAASRKRPLRAFILVRGEGFLT